MIKAEGLSKRYDRTVAVDGISFEVNRGEIVGFLGPNGAGKTTTMRMLTCFMPPSGGTATVAGYDINTQPEEVKRRIGYLPESPPVYLEMTVAEYLEFVGKLKGLRGSSVRTRLNDVIERCSIGEVRDKLIGKLSKGYRQRVGLAQAIIHNPDVLILDEPTSGFDPKQINETRDLIRSLAGEHTIILSTHILSEVEAMCQQVLIINRGHLVATDSVTNLTHRLRGAETVRIELGASNGQISEQAVRQQLELVEGVGRVQIMEAADPGVVRVDVDLMQGSARTRAELARSVMSAGWLLFELRPLAASLEEVFLSLTAAESTTSPSEPEPPIDNEKAETSAEEEA